MYVNPIIDCIHIRNLFSEEKIISIQTLSLVNHKQITCEACEESEENWICLHCCGFYCGRYVNAHFSEHFNKTSHCLCISMMDLSVWCYECDSYVSSKRLNLYEKTLSEVRFGRNFIPTVEEVGNQLSCYVKDKKKVENIKYWNFIELFRKDFFKNLLFLTGFSVDHEENSCHTGNNKDYPMDFNSLMSFLKRKGLERGVISCKEQEIDLDSVNSLVTKADLCFMIGVSVKSYSFQQVFQLLNRNCYRLVVNKVKENELDDVFQFYNVSNNELFLEGTFNEVLYKIIIDVGWKDEYDEYHEYNNKDKYKGNII